MVIWLDVDRLVTALLDTVESLEVSRLAAPVEAAAVPPLLAGLVVLTAIEAPVLPEGELLDVLVLVETLLPPEPLEPLVSGSRLAGAMGELAPPPELEVVLVLAASPVAEATCEGSTGAGLLGIGGTTTSCCAVITNCPST